PRGGGSLHRRRLRDRRRHRSRPRPGTGPLPHTAAARRCRLPDQRHAGRRELHPLEEKGAPLPITRRKFGKLALAAGATAPFSFVRAALAQPKRSDELVVGIWGRAPEASAT